MDLRRRSGCRPYTSRLTWRCLQRRTPRPQNSRLSWSVRSISWMERPSPVPWLWSLDSSVHQSVSAEPNAWLIPKPGTAYQPIWSQAGTLQVTRDVRYNAQRVMAVCTNIRTLGVSQWHTLLVHEDDVGLRFRREIALALWCNSTLGLMLNANHSNRSQAGRAGAIKVCWRP